MILTSTAGIICTTLLVWLIVIRWLDAPNYAGPVAGIALDLPATIPLPVASPTADVRLVSRTGAARPSVESGMARLRRELGDFLGHREGRSTLIYLSAVGATWTDGVTTQSSLLTASDVLGEGLAPLPIEEVTGFLQERARSSPILLILDAGQIDSDRELGLFGFDPTDLLRDSDDRLTVLLACAPGQRSWVAEGRGTSVFAYYLAEILDERARGYGLVTAGEILDYVRPRVAWWVREHRGGAIQTPMLLGDPDLSLRLPPPRSDGPSPAPDEKRIQAFRERLAREWTERHKLAAAEPPPHRYAPLDWRRYQTILLNAERRARSGDLSAADRGLDEAAQLRGKIEADRNGPPLASPWSLTLARRPEAVDQPADPVKFAELLDQPLASQAAPPPTKPGPVAPEADQPKTGEPKADRPKTDESKAGEPKTDESKAGEPKTLDAKRPADAPAPEPADAIVSLSSYVEGQVPSWYAEFVARGGESPAVREVRIPLIRQAVEIRTLAEEAAGLDDRVIPWVRPLVDQADVLRRRAQDRLFATNARAFEADPGCRDLFHQAQKLYEQARNLGQARREAFDLLDRLEDELPHYGDWLARRRTGLSNGKAGAAPFAEILALTADLAALAHAEAPSVGDRETAQRALIAATDELRARYRSFEATADDAIRTIVASGDWQEADALLYLPTLKVADRMMLLDRLGKAELTPALELDSTPPGVEERPSADPAFWTKAIGLARVEAALLAIAGRDTGPLTELIDAAEKAASDDRVDLGLEKLALFAGKVRKARAALVAEIRELPFRIDPDGSEAHQIRADDRAARILPLVELRRFPAETDPCRLRDNLDRHDLIVWHARRLCDDFALRQARQVLVLGRLGSGREGVRLLPGRDYQQVDADQMAYSDATIAVEVASDSREVHFEPTGKLPEGLAVAFNGHAPGDEGNAPLKPSAADGTFPTLFPVSTKSLAVFGFESGVPRPVAFFRGRVFTPRIEVEQLADVDWVQVAMHERVTQAPLGGRKFEWIDQFSRHPNRGYLHPVNSLVYKLSLTNTQDRPLMACVTYGFADVPEANHKVAVLTLPPGPSLDESIVGSVLPDDLPKIDEDRDFLVKITQDDRNGRRLAKDLTVTFRKINPEFPKDGNVAFAFGNGVIVLDVSRSPLDRVTGPVLCYVMVEPFTAVQQIQDPNPYIGLGRYIRYRYRVRPMTEAVKFTVKIDEIEVFSKEVQIQKLPKAPANPFDAGAMGNPAGAGGPGNAAGAVGFK